MEKSGDSFTIQPALLAEVDQMRALIRLSAAKLSVGFYSEAEISAANQYVFGVDSRLVEDGTYFTVYLKETLVGCGGWSFRKTLYGGDQRRMGGDDRLKPGVDAAKIRAFFVHPDFARRGIADLLMRHCEQAAKRAGFSALELMSTLPGVPFYSARGFMKIEEVRDPLPNGVVLPFVRMKKLI